jgi:diaminopimelate epimerase
MTSRGDDEVRGREFYKMTGSGNDFVFVDARYRPAGELDRPEWIRRVCARGTGVGADGVVFLEPPGRDEADFSIRYFNADGSLADLCGNASLCSVALASRLGAADGEGMRFDAGSGEIRGRITTEGPEIELGTVRDMDLAFDRPLEAGELRIGFALVGVPHLVIQCANVETVDLGTRGRDLRWSPALPHGANANFVSGPAGGWRIRTFERGVEGETLACGPGAVATAALLRAWNADGDSIELETRSGRVLRVTLPADGRASARLAGEGRLVFQGSLADLG